MHVLPLFKTQIKVTQNGELDSNFWYSEYSKMNHMVKLAMHVLPLFKTQIKLVKMVNWIQTFDLVNSETEP